MPSLPVFLSGAMLGRSRSQPPSEPRKRPVFVVALEHDEHTSMDGFGLKWPATKRVLSERAFKHYEDATKNHEELQRPLDDLAKIGEAHAIVIEEQKKVFVDLRLALAFKRHSLENFGAVFP